MGCAVLVSLVITVAVGLEVMTVLQYGIRLWTTSDVPGVLIKCAHGVQALFLHTHSVWDFTGGSYPCRLVWQNP